MKNLITLFTLIFMSLAVYAGDDDIMITRDGNFTKVKVVMINNESVTYVDLKNKKRGEQTVSTDFVYMIKKEKGNNIFFDSDGNQTTSPVQKLEDKANIIYTNDGKVFNAYNLSVNRDDVKYQLKDKKKEPVQTMAKSNIFMISYADGTNTVITTYKPKQQAQLPAAPQQQFQPQQQIPQQQTQQIPQQPQQSVGQSMLQKATPENNGNNANAGAQNPPTTQMQTIGQQSASLSLEAANANSQLISAYNYQKPSFDNMPKKKTAAKAAFCRLMVSPNSVLISDEVGIGLTTGYISRQDGDFYHALSIYNNALSVVIFNKTQKTMYLDLFNTYIKRGTEAQPYYTPSTTSNYEGGTSGGAVNLGAYSSILRGVTVGGSTSKSSTTVKYAQRVIAIPPMSSRTLDPQLLIIDNISDFIKVRAIGNSLVGSYTSLENLNMGDIANWNEQNSPARFAFYLTYAYDEALSATYSTQVDMYLAEIYGLKAGANSWTGTGPDKYITNWENSLFFVTTNERSSKGFSLGSLGGMLGRSIK